MLDPKIISRLAEIVEKSNLTEFEYEDEGCRISMSKHHPAPGCAASSVCAGTGSRTAPAGSTGSDCRSCRRSGCSR